MKTLFNVFFAALVAVSLVACGGGAASPSQTLVRTWKIDKTEIMKAFNDMMGKQKASMGEGAPAEVVAQMDEALKSMDAAFDKMRLEFKADGTTSLTGPNAQNPEEIETKQGTWKLSEDGKTLTMTESGKDEVYEVKSIAADKVVLSPKGEKDPNDPTSNIDLILLPA